MSIYSPAQFFTGFWKWFGVGIFCLAIFAGVGVVGWKLHWWLANSTVNHQTQIIQNSDSNQRALVADITEKIGDVATATEQMDGTSGQQYADLHAQRLGFARQACGDAAQLSSADVLGDGVPQWIRTNCLAGNLSPDSPLNK